MVLCGSGRCRNAGAKIPPIKLMSYLIKQPFCNFVLAEEADSQPSIYVEGKVSGPFICDRTNQSIRRGDVATLAMRGASYPAIEWRDYFIEESVTIYKKINDLVFPIPKIDYRLIPDFEFLAADFPNFLPIQKGSDILIIDHEYGGVYGFELASGGGGDGVEADDSVEDGIDFDAGLVEGDIDAIDGAYTRKFFYCLMETWPVDSYSVAVAKIIGPVLAKLDAENWNSKQQNEYFGGS